MSGKLLKTEGGFVIDRPGNVLFIPVKADKSLDWANAKRNTARINTITITNSKTKTEIPDGNSFYPAGDRVTAIAGTVAIEFSTVDPDIWAMNTGTVVKNNANDTMIKMYEYMKISEANTIEVPEQYKTDAFVKVVGSDGTEYEKAEAEPNTGEFKVEYTSDKTTFTFSADDAGKSVAITMTTVAKTMSYEQGRQAMRNHKIIIDTEYSTLDEAERIPVNFIISQASISGDVVENLQKDPSTTKTLTYTMSAPLPGEQPYEVKFLDKETA